MGFNVEIMEIKDKRISIRQGLDTIVEMEEKSELTLLELQG